MKQLFLAVLCLFMLACAAVTEDSQTHTWQRVAPKYDMLDWMTMDADLAAGFHMTGTHDLYSVVLGDKFYWVKSPNGYPWDIQLYDSKYIYLWITEQDWLDPFSYKKSLQNMNMPFMARFAYSGQRIRSNHTQFEIVKGCKQVEVHDLGTMINSLNGPYLMNWGGDVGKALTLIVSYQYDCDAVYGHCRDREQYFLVKRYGLVRWHHQVLKADGTYAVPDNESTFNFVVPGAAPIPKFPCF